MDYRTMSYVAPEVLPHGDVMQPAFGTVFAMSTGMAMTMPDAVMHVANLFAMMANQDVPIVNVMHRAGRDTFTTLASAIVTDTHGVAKAVAWFGRDVDTLGIVFDRGEMVTVAL